MDGKELTKDKEFTVKEGSIVVTLLPEFVENLSVGKHTLGIVSLSGTAVADFTVTGTHKPGNGEETGESEEQTNTLKQTENDDPTSCDEPSNSDTDVTTATAENSVGENTTVDNMGYLSPNTGDNLHVKAWVIISGLLAGAYMTFRFKKK